MLMLVAGRRENRNVGACDQLAREQDSSWRTALAGEA